MIYEHEIPKGSILYFGKSAELKREIENIANKILKKNGYQEIVTPFFSYHQKAVFDEKELVRINDEKNHLLTLRADTTLDVVRLITKRLGRSVEYKRWFYIQPVFRYPSIEIYQVGAEYIGSNDLNEPINIASKIFYELNMAPILQISDIKIPKILSKELDISMEIFENGNIEKILELEIKWLEKLACLQNKEDMKSVIDISPNCIKEELKRMYEIGMRSEYDHILFSPLYYSKMRYYDSLFFRFFAANKTLALGGCYTWDEIEAVGFAGYIDTIIETKGKESNE